MNGPSRSIASRAVALVVAITTLLGPAGIAGAAPLAINWHSVVFPDTTPTWSASPLPNEGGAYFVVNGTGIPTRTAGAPRLVTYRIPASNSVSQFTANEFSAPFDSALLREGPNTFTFQYLGLSVNSNGVPVETRDYVTLSGQNVSAQLLFRFAHNGNDLCTMYSDIDGNPRADGTYDDDCREGLERSTTLNFTLEQIDPLRVKHIADLEAAIKADLETLVANASLVSDLARKLGALTQLRAEVIDLLRQPIDDISPDDLNDILRRYPDLPEATRNALVKLVEDLHRSVAELRDELARITRDFGQQTDALAGIVEAGARAGGFEPLDRAEYEPSAAFGTVTDVAVPDVGAGSTFNPAYNPYSAYADAVIARLTPFAVGDDVTDRAAFISVVRGWRANVAALERALLQRGASHAEQNAFNAARERVALYLRGYVDGQDWFIKSPVPAETKSLVDTILARQFADLAPRIKEALNEWREQRATEREQMLLDTVDVLARGAEEAEDELDQYDTRPAARAALNDVTTLLKTIGGLSAGATPGVGDGVDVCEAVSGREFCSPNGQPLSVGERVVSLLGVIVGSGKFWRGAGLVLTGAGAMVVTRAAHIADRLVDLGLLERKAIVRRLGHGIVHLDDIPGKEIVRLTDKLGETSVLQLGPQIKGKGLQELEELKFFEKLMPAADLAHAKTHGAAVKGLPPLAGKNISDIRAMLRQLGFVPHPGSTAQEVWTHADASVVRIATQGTVLQPGPHLKKEIARVAHDFSRGAIASKVTDAGMLVPPEAAGADGATLLLSNWFRGIVGRAPDPNVGGELTLLEKVWADASHIPYTP